MNLAILIDGDIENSLGGACTRDIWNITNKLLKETNINKNNIFVFLHKITNDLYAKKLYDIGITNIQFSTIINIKQCFDKIIELSKEKLLKIIFHYSGHGYQTLDLDGDEVDGMDEIFLGHAMSDDFIWNNFVSKLGLGTMIYAFMDACHAGSGMDFPYSYVHGNWTLCKKKNLYANCSGISFSACNDSQCASQDVGNTTGFGGSLTVAFCDYCNYNTLFECPVNTYRVLSDRLKLLNQTVELYCIHKPL